LAVASDRAILASATLCSGGFGANLTRRMTATAANAVNPMNQNVLLQTFLSLLINAYVKKNPGQTRGIF